MKGFHNSGDNELNYYMLENCFLNYMFCFGLLIFLKNVQSTDKEFFIVSLKRR